VNSGFTEKHQDEFKWADKISPIMKRWYIRDDNGECRAESEEILQENTAASMVEILPRLIRRKVDAALKTRNYVAAMNILTIHWGGQK
jgi:hypothetical protein